MSDVINKNELNKILKNLKQLTPKMQKGILNLAVKAGAKDVQEAAKRYVPVRSGRLRDSIKIKKKSIREKKKDGDYSASTVYKVAIQNWSSTGGVWYASTVEFGAKHFAPVPFMTPAFELNGNGALNAMKAYIKRRFEAAVKKGLIR